MSVAFRPLGDFLAPKRRRVFSGCPLVTRNPVVQLALGRRWLGDLLVLLSAPGPVRFQSHCVLQQLLGL